MNAFYTPLYIFVTKHHSNNLQWVGKNMEVADRIGEKKCSFDNLRR